MISRKTVKKKILCIGKVKGFGGEGVCLANKWVDKVIGISR